MLLLAWRPGQRLPDHRTSPGQTPRCGALVLGLFVGGPGGRNYTRDDPVLLGLPAFQVGFTFVAGLWFYPPPSVATTELIPLMSSYSGHHIATPHTWKWDVLCWSWLVFGMVCPVCHITNVDKGSEAQRLKLFIQFAISFHHWKTSCVLRVDQNKPAPCTSSGT